MGRKIDQRATLFSSSAAAAGSTQTAPAFAAAANATPLSVGGGGGREAKAADKAARQAQAASEVAALDAETTRDFELPGRDWGLGFGNLSAVQDAEVAFLINADGSISIVESGGGGYNVRTGFPTQGYFVSHIFQDAGVHVTDTAEVLHDFSDRKRIVLQAGENNFAVRGGAADVFGTGAAESITGSQGNDIVHGGGGNDNIIGAGGQDVAWGGAGNDLVAGNEGQDFVGGGVGNDTVDGGQGDDFVTGGAGIDSLLGGEGRDVLMGGDGADSVDGGVGRDTLIAGLGADKVTGGDDADVFVFTEGDSGAGLTQLDTVLDFEVGLDKLDLTGFQKQLTVVAAFTNHTYEMMFTDSDTGTTVKIDINGDGTADQEIAVTVEREGDEEQGHLTIDDFVV